VNIESKYEALKNIVRELRTVLVAYSGGMDSTLLLKTCVDVLGNGCVVAFTGNAPTFPAKEIEEARQTASDIGAEYVLFDTAILKNRLFVENTTERCYHCKKNLLHIAAQVAQEKNMACIADGTNFDDTKDFRPGSAAVKETGVVSPLLKAELTKDDIRGLSRKLSLPTQDKPPYACLATRVPYGTPIDAVLLKQIELSEEFIKGVGISQVRVRHHGNMARIEVTRNDLDTILREQKRIVHRLKGYGFTYVALDLEGYRTGSMNEGQ
jgi:pyridinium-3,5-biscarboxylic acid mononucleotide sulfurtransferase